MREHQNPNLGLPAEDTYDRRPEGPEHRGRSTHLRDPQQWILPKHQRSAGPEADMLGL